MWDVRYERKNLTCRFLPWVGGKDGGGPLSREGERQVAIRSLECILNYLPSLSWEALHTALGHPKSRLRVLVLR